MAGDDITNAELARRLDAMHRDVHEDLGDIRRRMDSYVLREVYLADQRGSEARMLAAERDLADLRTTLKTVEERREASAKADIDRRATERRFMVGVVAIPILTLIVQIVLAVRGPV